MFGPGLWFLGSLLSLAFWVLVIVVIAHLVRSRPPAPGAPTSSALRVLEERYARGEIGREEFLERRTVLTGHHVPGSPPPPPPAPTNAANTQQL